MKLQKGFKLIIPERIMEKTRFYFHELQMEEVTDEQIIELFDKVKQETESDDSPYYIEKNNSKHHIQIISKDEQEKEIYYFGKLIQSHKTADFREEKWGELIEIDLDEDFGICKMEKGVIYFILYLNKETNQRLMVVEDVPFALNIGGIVNYLKQRLNKNNLKTKQKLGRELVPVLNAIGDNKITLARLRLKRNITTEEIEQLGVVEDAFKELKKEDLDCELQIRWTKGKGELFKDFLKKLFKIETISEISSVDFGGFLRTLYFDIDSDTYPHMNMKDNIIKFFPPKSKEYYLNNEDELYRSLKEDFDDKRNNNRLNG